MPVEEYEDVKTLKSLVQRHLKFTGSEVARRILLNWDRERPNFKKVRPKLSMRSKWRYNHTPCILLQPTSANTGVFRAVAGLQQHTTWPPLCGAASATLVLLLPPRCSLMSISVQWLRQQLSRRQRRIRRRQSRQQVGDTVFY